MTVDGFGARSARRNFDDRSFETNDEITLGIAGCRAAAQFDEIFERDSKRCVELKLDSWLARGVGHRLKDNALHLFNEFL